MFLIERVHAPDDEVRGLIGELDAEGEARNLGLRVARLETGVHQPAAIGFYRRMEKRIP